MLILPLPVASIGTLWLLGLLTIAVVRFRCPRADHAQSSNGSH